MKSKELVNQQYKELAAQLGDAYFTLSKLNLRIKTLEEQMEGLNMAAPLLTAAELELLKEKDSE